MRSTWIAFPALLLVALVAPPACGGEYGLGVRVGTQGLGVEAARGFTDWLSIRAGVYGGSLSESVEEGGIDYDGDLTVGGAGVLADFFPLRGSFRLTAGLLANRNEIELRAVPTQPTEIGGTVYTPAQIGTLFGDVDFDSTAPYVGIGTGNLADGRRVGFLFDLGMLRQGSGDVSLSSSTGLVSPDDLQREIDELEEDIESYDLWPVLSFGLAIRF